MKSVRSRVRVFRRESASLSPPAQNGTGNSTDCPRPVSKIQRTPVERSDAKNQVLTAMTWFHHEIIISNKRHMLFVRSTTGNFWGSWRRNQATMVCPGICQTRNLWACRNQVRKSGPFGKMPFWQKKFRVTPIYHQVLPDHAVKRKTYRLEDKVYDQNI